MKYTEFTKFIIVSVIIKLMEFTTLVIIKKPFDTPCNAAMAVTINNNNYHAKSELAIPDVHYERECPKII